MRIAMRAAVAVFGVLSLNANAGADERGSCPSATGMEYFVSTKAVSIGAGQGKTMVEEGFTQGGDNPACVVITFRVVVDSRPSEETTVRARLDHDIPPIGAGEFWYDTAGGKLGSTFLFVFPSVVPGPHVVTLRASGHIVPAVRVSERTVLINHTP